MRPSHLVCIPVSRREKNESFLPPPVPGWVHGFCSIDSWPALAIDQEFHDGRIREWKFKDSQQVRSPRSHSHPKAAGYVNQQTQEQSGQEVYTLKSSAYMVLKIICINILVLLQVATNCIAYNQVYCSSGGWKSPRISLAQIKLSLRWHSFPQTPRAFNPIPSPVSNDHPCCMECCPFLHL